MQILNMVQMRHHHSHMKPFRVSARVQQEDVLLCAGVRGSALCVCVLTIRP